jgi:hypothetical protein
MYPFALWDTPTRSTSASTRRNALKLARQGNARAIATLMNHTLMAKGITARASLQEGCLWVVLEGRAVPHQKDMMRFVYSGVSRLEIPTLKVVRVYGMRTGQANPAWSEDILLDQPFDQPLNDDGEDAEASKKGITPLQVDGSAQPLQDIYSKLASTPPGATQDFANSPLSNLLGKASAETPHDDALAEATANSRRIPISLPLTEPVPSQLRLMAFLKVLTAITVLVAAGSFLQVILPLKGFPGADDPLMIRVVGSASLLSMAIVAWVALLQRTGIDLHPKHAQRAYIRLGFALLVNVGCALLLMVLFSMGILTPSPLVIFPLFALCIGLWMLGCCSLSKAKGYHPIWGIAGILLLDGAILLSIFPDRGLTPRRGKRTPQLESTFVPSTSE